MGVKFKNCCSVSCCFPTGIVPVSCTVLSGAEKPNLSYLLALCVPQFLICEIGVIRLKRNIARTITGWRDRNKVVKGLSMSIQLVSLFSYPACTSLCMSQRTSGNHQHTINAAQSPLKCKESRIQMFTFSGDSRYLCLTDLTRE